MGICILLIFMLELAGGIYAYTKTKDLQKDIQVGLKEAIVNSYGNSTDADDSFKDAVDWFRINVKCCGSEKPADWKDSYWYKTKGQSKKTPVPESCCKEKKTGCNNGKVEDLVKAKKIYTTGCVPEGTKYVKTELYKVGGAAIGIGVIQLLGIVFAAVSAIPSERKNRKEQCCRLKSSLFYILRVTLDGGHAIKL